jgi:hypothetical protein
MQAPPVQLSAMSVSQLMQEAPKIPQVANEGLLQVFPVQQPLGQLEELHTHCPRIHCCPAEQAELPPHIQAPSEHESERVVLQLTQLLPFTPHELIVEVVQVFPEQQPLGQERRSHTQFPFSQRWPALHAGPVPQLHCPRKH